MGRRASTAAGGAAQGPPAAAAVLLAAIAAGSAAPALGDSCRGAAAEGACLAAEPDESAWLVQTGFRLLQGLLAHWAGAHSRFHRDLRSAWSGAVARRWRGPGPAAEAGPLPVAAAQSGVAHTPGVPGGSARDSTTRA
ncbi:unnamed protein product [Prorocentrum cordatum]|uniref:Uncharacterized protein n=1 Tax=Prorocentrum cordatum TaxID=2364126 RepID=A0ABN9TTK8_9DINO|nr:unnamed protein product [Polarella glacialis]